MEMKVEKIGILTTKNHEAFYLTFKQERPLKFTKLSMYICLFLILLLNGQCDFIS